MPAHLRRFVVEQDYAQYNAIDQAVWRFVLLQTYGRLVETAHPTYRDGLAATGISVDHIPRISEMNERLSRFGWGAVCVDGFIPPRAFQEFQAHGILPIAADIRTRQHLAYTPAPDIIHEAAGHAPILPERVYARFLRRIGALGAQAFTVPEEDRVFEAIHELSEVKEDPAYDAATLVRAEAELQAAIASVPEASEAARLSRLYWWTAEYGLVGGVDDYKIYGAGLLSSLGESHSCHDPSVRKLPLTVACMDVAYDITRTQPQLFVAASFEALHDVLDQAERQLAQERAGAGALRRAVSSRDVASVRFSSGAWAIGTVRGAGPTLDRPSWLELEGPGAFAWGGKIHPAQRHLGFATGRMFIPVGRLADGRALESLTDVDLDASGGEGTGAVKRNKGSGSYYEFRFASGALVEGKLERRVREDAAATATATATATGRLMHLELSDVVLSLPGRTSLSLPRYALVAAGELENIRAGAVDPAFYPETEFSPRRVPRPRLLDSREQRLVSLYRQAQGAGEAAGLRAVHEVLVSDYPEEWLLRWNILESLHKAGAPSAVTRPLRQELEHLENVFQKREPIASGLRYLAGQTGSG